MKQDKPTQQEWHALYEVAAEFRKLEQWRWMDDSDEDREFIGKDDRAVAKALGLEFREADARRGMTKFLEGM